MNDLLVQILLGVIVAGVAWYLLPGIFALIVTLLVIFIVVARTTT